MNKHADIEDDDSSEMHSRCKMAGNHLLSFSRSYDYNI